MRTATLLFAVTASSCDTPKVPELVRFKCRADFVPCGNGCIPSNSICCDPGHPDRSSYCANAAGAGCWPNPGVCTNESVPGGGASAFCCMDPALIPPGSDGFGSFDCPEGQTHCGQSCQFTNAPCCRDGDDCPNGMPGDWCADQAAEPVVPCGVCMSSGICSSCPDGFCCQVRDLCGGDVTCVPGPGVCVGVGGGGDADADTDADDACSSDAQCADFAGRHCEVSAVCASDALCHCCVAVCVGYDDCACLTCAEGCGYDECEDPVCIHDQGGGPGD